VSARVPSAVTTMGDRPEAFPHAEVPALVVAAEGLTVAAGDGGNRGSGMFLPDREI